MRPQYILILLFILLLGACKPTKYVPENEYLLSDVKINFEELEMNPSDLKPYLKQKPNLKILGLFKFHLGLYNMSGSNMDRWWNRWFRRIGEEPVVYDEFLVERSAQELQKYLNNKGYLYADVEDTTIFLERKHKAKVIYDVTPNKPFTILDHKERIDDPNIKSLVDADSANTLIKDGDNFDVDILNQERDRITNLLRQKGYYNFSRDYIYYMADSSIQPLSIVDTLILRNPTIVNALNQKVESTHLQYTIRDIYFITDFDPQKALKEPSTYYEAFDTTEYNGLKILYQDKLKIKPLILSVNNLIRRGELFNYRNVERTHALLAAIPIIRYVNIRFNENKTIEPTLDCFIQITYAKSQGYSFDIEGTNQSGNIGAAINLGYNHKNLFKGGEMFNTKLSVARETQTGLKDKTAFNSDELGFETSLLYPRFLFPFLSNYFVDNIKSNTNFKASINFQRRPDYERYIASLGTQYNLKNKSNWSHQFIFPDLNYVSIPFMTDTFKQYINPTFLKYSYENHVILGAGYNVAFNDQEIRKYRDSKYFRIGFESSGNFMYLYNQIAGTTRPENGYNFLGIKYSQYVKFDLEGTYNRRIDDKNAIVYHAAFGLGLPYGNSDVLPFEKRYFGGGANGVRGWQVRQLGPGIFKEANSIYMNKTGDVKLQFNLEYRFKLIWVVEGALFSDVGNIWTIRDYNEDQPGGVFRFNSFYNQLAMAYGIGARLDFSFFVFRVDLGIRGYDPARPAGNRWVSSPSFTNDMVLNLAIGYPF
ncbi:BamA/TamA family outer membrane protein [Saccharicrinis sp. FJH62]|uniref:translocation and assembly module lipoprotein TamL n=1 Tax=Saccharicrinis sp. FJH62 TaxID=3344657 RepID=UPI0035D46EC2